MQRRGAAVSDSQDDIRRENGDGAPSGAGGRSRAGSPGSATRRSWRRWPCSSRWAARRPRWSRSRATAWARCKSARTASARRRSVRTRSAASDPRGRCRSSEIEREHPARRHRARRTYGADAPRVLDAQDDADVVPACGEGGDLAACSNRLSVLLPSGSWLVQGKLVIAKSAGFASGGASAALSGATHDARPGADREGHRRRRGHRADRRAERRAGRHESRPAVPGGRHRGARARHPDAHGARGAAGDGRLTPPRSRGPPPGDLVTRP